MSRRSITWTSLTILIPVIAIFVYLNLFDDSEVLQRKTEAKVIQHTKNEDLADKKIDSEENKSIASKSTDRLRLIKSDDDINKKAEDFYGVVFPGMMQNAMGNTAYESYNEAITEKPLLVEDFFKKMPLTKLVPHMAGEKLLAVSVFRRYDGKIYKPAQLLDVSTKGWGTFPPVSKMDAELLLVNKMQNSYAYKSGLVHIDGVSPNYQFVVPGEDRIVYLVNAFSGEINVFPADIKIPNLEEESPPVKLDENGLLIVDFDKTESLSPTYISKLKDEIEQSNAEIKAGLLKIGPDLKVIYDKRNRKSVVSDNN
jgi:hypothetical protein